MENTMILIAEERRILGREVLYQDDSFLHTSRKAFYILPLHEIFHAEAFKSCLNCVLSVFLDVLGLHCSCNSRKVQPSVAHF